MSVSPITEVRWVRVSYRRRSESRVAVRMYVLEGDEISSPSISGQLVRRRGAVIGDDRGRSTRWIRRRGWDNFCGSGEVGIGEAWEAETWRSVAEVIPK